MRWLVVAIALLLTLASSPARVSASGGQLEVNVVDRDTHKPIACRVRVENGSKRPQKPPKLPYWRDHFALPGSVILKLPKGKYTFEMERGLEYLTRSGYFDMDNFSDDSKTVDLHRFVDMSADGWWSGDLSIERPPRELELLMDADDLHVAPAITIRNQKSVWTKKDPLPKKLLIESEGQRWRQLLGEGLSTSGGRVLLLNLEQPIELPAAGQELPSALDLILEARKQHGAWIDVERASSWDLPVWIAHGVVDSIELAGGELCRDAATADEANCKPRETAKFPGAVGVGRWNEAIYYHLLNCGLRIPPSAGSGSGVSSNPVGFNRVYAKVEGEFSYERWWESLRAGRVTITNGPLLRPSVEGEAPGHVFEAAKGQEVEFEIGLNMSTREKVPYLEIVKNGRVAQGVPLDEWTKAKGKLPLVKFERSGWMLVRAATENRETYRFGCTAPYYVEIDGQTSISRKSASFFLDWVRERMKKLKIADERERERILEQHRQAERFWQNLVDRANVE